MAELTIANLNKAFGSFSAVKDVSITVADGEFVSLLGPSGCGKSTTLAAIAGLERPTSGRISIGQRVCYDGATGVFLPPEARGCGLVFQSYALWPHMTVRQNLAFPLKLRRVDKAQQARRIGQVLDLVEMTAYAERYPHELSGGQQQRVALARTLVYGPDILLLDEPLSNLDAKLRDRARIWLAELRDKVRMTTIYVTHDQVEALSLSDRIVVMHGGEIAQIGTPQEIFERPVTTFVADFIGTTSFLTGEVLGDGAAAALRLKDGQVVALPGHTAVPPGSAATVALRPRHIAVVTDGGPGQLRARVTGQSYIGGRWQVTLEAAGCTLRLDVDERVDAGDLDLRIAEATAAVFPAAHPHPVTAGAAA